MTDIPGRTLPAIINYSGIIFVGTLGTSFLIGLVIAYLVLGNVKKSIISSFLGTLLFYFILSAPVSLILNNVVGRNIYHYDVPDFNFSFFVTHAISGIASGILGILLASCYTKLIQHLDSQRKWIMASQMAVRKLTIAGSLAVVTAALIFLISTAWLAYVNWRFYNIPVLRYYFYPPVLIGTVVILAVLVIAIYILKIEFKRGD